MGGNKSFFAWSEYVSDYAAYASCSPYDRYVCDHSLIPPRRGFTLFSAAVLLARRLNSLWLLFAGRRICVPSELVTVAPSTYTLLDSICAE